MKLMLALLMLHQTRVDPSLKEAYNLAVESWQGRKAEVREVRWCDQDCPAPFYFFNISAMWDKNTKTIYVKKDSSWLDWQLRVTLSHEYGHALGLGHSKVPGSIMSSGWEPPVGDRPDGLDFIELRRLNK